MRIRILRLVLLSIWFLMLIAFIYVFFKFSYIEKEVVFFVSAYGLIAIFFTAFLSDLIMQPIGPDMPLVLGILGGGKIIEVLLAAVIGSYIASLLGYYMGRRFGHGVFLKYYGKKKYKKWEGFYNKYGNAAVAIAALTPVPYVPVCWISGILRMRISRFFIFGLIPRFLRFVGVILIVLFIKGV